MILYVPLNRLVIRAGSVDQKLLENIKKQGFQVSHPVVLPKTGFRVIDGASRVRALRCLTPQRLHQALSAFNGLVPCIRGEQ